jgi:hypothetical protein
MYCEVYCCGSWCIVHDVWCGVSCEWSSVQWFTCMWQCMNDCMTEWLRVNFSPLTHSLIPFLNVYYEIWTEMLLNL